MVQAATSLGDVRTRLEAFDGKAITVLSELNATYGAIPDFTQHLIELSGEGDEIIQRGASWILLDRITTDGLFTESEYAALAKVTLTLTDWQAALHILQILCKQPAPIVLTPNFAEFAQLYSNHKRPFLRAWSISALHALAKINPELAPMSQRAIEKGKLDQAASVQARLKHLK